MGEEVAQETVLEAIRDIATEPINEFETTEMRLGMIRRLCDKALPARAESEGSAASA